MRIGLVTHNYPSGLHDRQNAGIFVHDLAQALKKGGHEVFVLCPDNGRQKQPDKVPVTWFSWKGQSKKLGDLSLKNPSDWVYFFDLFRQGIKNMTPFIKDNKIDFCVAMWAFPAGVFCYFAKRKLKVPYLTWCLGSDIYVYAKLPILKQLIVKILKSSSAVFADGIDLAQTTQNLFSGVCQFVPSATKLPNMPDHQAEFRHPSALHLMFLGRMEPVKGPDVLIDAACLIKDLDFELHLMGEGALLGALEQQVTTFGLADKVIFHGNVADPAKIEAYLSSADWLIIPSRSDSIPLAFSEAAKNGTPLLVAAVGDMAQLVRQYQVGLTFGKGDVKQLAKLLRDIIKNRGKRAIYAANTPKVSLLFNIDTSAKKLAEEAEKWL
ncbi:glycosyltransferase [Candidatus Daviesbacteria bacterium]|nr:glycosyltransferase [Candidatus Daviesbacteria bacterium]